jgi:cell division protein FtsQ
VLGLVVVLAVIGSGFGLTRTPALDVDHIAITGWSHDQREDILTASGITVGAQLTDIDPDASARRIEALVPWVAAARVTRTWPGSILITVVERRPVARVLTDRGTWMALDGAGHLLEEADTPQPELITVEGSSPGATPGAVLAPAAAKGVAVLAQMSPSLLSRTHALRFVHRGGVAGPDPGATAGDAPALAPPHTAPASNPATSGAFAGPEVELVLEPAGSVAFGPPEQVQMKLLALETVLARVDLTCLEAIDVRVPRRPLVKRNAECEAQLAG